MKKILVVGSLNMDAVIETPRIPKAGETISGSQITLVPGGKGANQAYAAGRLGGKVAMIGAVGEDTFGNTLKESLENAGVDTGGIAVLKGRTTGQAFISVDEKGENSIVIIAGANAEVTKEMAENNKERISESDIVIMQLEIPVETVLYVKNMAKKMGKLVIIDPAPAAADLPDEFWKEVDFIKPNETELEILTGKKQETEEEMIKGARIMLQKGVKGVIVTLGEKGCLLVTEEKEEFFEAEKVTAVDTTAAGDSFTAAFAFALSKGYGTERAVRFGQKAASVAVTRKGAQTSMPEIEELPEDWN